MGRQRIKIAHGKNIDSIEICGLLLEPVWCG